jgi:hypothetical protein
LEEAHGINRNGYALHAHERGGMADPGRSCRCYRLVDLFGWSDLINTRITARVPGPDDHFLINPYGLLFDEITASSLVKIDAKGNKVEPSACRLRVLTGGGRAGLEIRRRPYRRVTPCAE